jgi:dUTP pyrophosphatase
VLKFYQKEKQMRIKEFDLKIKKLSESAVIPEYKTDGASGMDLSSTERVTLMPFERKLVPTGLAIQLEQGFEAQLRPRSGTSIKHGLTLVNCVGTIDSDYTGEIFIPMINLSSTPYTIEIGERVAQMVVARYTSVGVKIVDELDETERGSGGFGSTGTK